MPKAAEDPHSHEHSTAPHLAARLPRLFPAPAAPIEPHVATEAAKQTEHADAPATSPHASSPRHQLIPSIYVADVLHHPHPPFVHPHPHAAHPHAAAPQQTSNAARGSGRAEEMLRDALKLGDGELEIDLGSASTTAREAPAPARRGSRGITGEEVAKAAEMVVEHGIFD